MTKEDAPYSNRELDTRFLGVHEKLDLILVQTTNQTGRVGKIEARNNYIAGGIAVVIIVCLPTFGFVFKQVNDQIQSLGHSVNRIQERIPADISTSLK